MGRLKCILEFLDLEKSSICRRFWVFVPCAFPSTASFDDDKYADLFIKLKYEPRTHTTKNTEILVFIGSGTGKILSRSGLRVSRIDAKFSQRLLRRI